MCIECIRAVVKRDSFEVEFIKRCTVIRSIKYFSGLKNRSNATKRNVSNSRSEKMLPGYFV